MWRTKTYFAWIDMRQRCLNPNNWHFKWYGGRGIKVCERWADFRNFLSDMGVKPEGMTLERKNVNGNYDKSNCCWIPQATQARNRRNNRKLTHDGKTMLVVEWAEYLGIPHTRLKMRLFRGWAIERALTP